MASMIQKGDQYLLPIKIMSNSTYISPSDVDDVRIQVGKYLKEYSKSEITYTAATHEWNFPLDLKMSLEFSGALVPILIGVKIGTAYMYSTTVNENVGQSIIKKEW